MSTAPITSQTLDPIVIQIAVLAGVLRKKGDDTYELNEAWFSDPWAYISKIPSNPQMFELITTLMGSASGNALGTPTQALDRTWYPIMNTTGAVPKPTGIYLVSGTPKGATNPEVGIGALYKWDYSDSFKVLPYAYFPLFTLPNEQGDGFGFVLGSAGHPVQTGIQIDGGNGFFSTGNGAGSLSFDGFNAGADFLFSLNETPKLNLVFQNLRLPGETQGSNRSIIDLIESTSVPEWITIALSTLGSQLAQLGGAGGTAGRMINTLIQLLGLTGNVPPINWVAIVDDPASTGKELATWIRNIAAQPVAMKSWLNAWYCLFNGLDASVSTGNVTGSGTRTDPFAVEILKLDITSTVAVYFDIGFAVQTEPDTTLHLYPNLIIRSKPVQPVFGLNTFSTGIRGMIELLEFKVPPAASNLPAAYTLFPGMSLMATGTNTDPSKPLFSVKISESDTAAFSIDALQVGFTYDRSAEAVSNVPTPNFRMVNVQSPMGTWPVIDLAQINENAILEAIGPAVSAAIESFFGENNTYAKAFEAVLGIAAPASYSGVWPLQNQLLLSPSELSLLIENPFNALGAYYTRCLTTNDGTGKPLFSYLLPAFVTLLGGTASTVTGGGSSADPWNIPVFTLGTATLFLQSWQTGTAANSLQFALSFEVPVAIGGVKASSRTSAELLRILLPAADGSGNWGGDWLQAVYTRLELSNTTPGPLTTPALAGVSLETPLVSGEAGWSNGTGFYASATVESLKLKSASVTIDLGTLQFGTTNWSAEQLKQLTPAIINGAGLLLLENGGRLGVSTAGLLGLMPNLQQIFNGSGTGYPFPVPSLTLPANWPTLSITDFSNPWTGLVNQLSAIYNGGTALVIPGMQLAGWALTGELPAAPVSNAQGTYNDPWKIQLAGIPLPVNLLTWIYTSGQTGYGIQYPWATTISQQLHLEVSSTLCIPGFRLHPPGAVPPALPELRTFAQLKNTDSTKPLYENALTGLVIGDVLLGFNAHLGSGTITYQPIFVFQQSRIKSGDPLTTYELTQTADGPVWSCPQGTLPFEALMNALMDQLTAIVAAGASGQLKAMLDLLAQLRILSVSLSPDTVPVASYGFNAGAWQALLADPKTYLVQHAEAVLNDDALAPAFMQAVAQLLGNTLALPGGLAPLLESLGLAEQYGTVYVPDFKGLMELVHQPAAFLADRTSALLADKPRLTALLTALKPYADSSGWFSIDPSGMIVSVGLLPASPLVIGNELQLSAQAVIDLNAGALTLQATAASKILGSALQYNFVPAFTSGLFTGTGVLTFNSWTDGAYPAAFPPLQLWPIPADVTPIVNQLAVQVPVTLLSAFTGSYLNTFVASQNEAVVTLLRVIGLAFTDDTAATRIRPLEGVFMHPINWLLSTEVIGNGSGGIDFSKLGTLLYAGVNAAGISSGDVKLLPYSHDGLQDGLQLTGLPWGTSLVLYANNTEGVCFSGSFTPALAAPLPQITLNGKVALAAGNNLNISGNSRLAFDLGTNSQSEAVSLTIIPDYNRGRFTLTAETKTGSAAAVSYSLLPFTGLNQFLSGGLPALLVETVGDMLFKAYDDYIKKNPGSGLEIFVSNIESITGITNGKTLYDFFAAIATDPLAAFTPAQIEGTVSGMWMFMTNILMIEGFSISDDKKYLQYLMTFTSLPQAKVLIQVGIQDIDTGAGKIPVFGIWVQPKAQFEWITLGLSGTGIGVETPFNLQNPNLVYAAAFTVGINTDYFGVEGLPSPVLKFALNGTLHQLNGPFLQLFPVAESTASGTLRIDLLPHCRLVLVDQPDASATAWMLAFGTDFLVPLVANMALQTTTVKGWLDDTVIGGIKGLPGTVLTNWGLLTKTTTGNYVLSNLKTAFDVSDPVAIVTKLIFCSLDLLSGVCVVPIRGKGIYVESRDEGTQKRYGIRVEIPDIVVSSGPDKMTLTFQLGKFFALQDKTNNWTGIQSDPGLTAFFINQKKADQSLSFWPRFELMSIGFDFAGPNNQKPLVSLNGVSIQAIRPRVLVVLDLLDGNVHSQFGAATMADTIGIPLGPGFADSGPSTNPVAQNLLTSSGNPGKTDAVNPAFSLSAAYVYNGSGFTFQLYNPDGTPTNKIIIPIMRAFGPLQCRKIGIGWQNAEKELDVLFDGSVSLAGLSADVQDLEIGIPVTDPANFSKYKLDLAGLDVSFRGGPVSITGGFLKDDSLGYIQYIGQAQVKAAEFGLGAFGAYALVDDNVSLFIFAYLNAPLGGPPYLFVKGLSGGFGFNRAFNMPRADQVYNFPFVAGISNPAALGGVNGKPPTNMQALQKIGTEIAPPQLGSYWLAAGIKFTSFQLIDAQAMLVVQFGTDFMIGLLGLAGMKLPKTGAPYAGVEMAFSVNFRLSTGLLAMEAVLTPNSYLISRDCRLTGGMAFYIWFKNQPSTGASAGEFVFTIGGYNDHFNKPAYFPEEPRVGFSWVVGDVSIKGGAYFALTPSAIMAGGSLEAVYATGNLRAWFKAWADFLIMWNPFYFHIWAGINVGASYTVKFIWTTTFKVELGADLELWGPPTGGSVTVKWWVISFTVKFGDQGSKNNGSKIIGWNDFQTYFLPEPQAPNPPPQQRADHPAGAAQTQSRFADQPKVKQVTQITAANGLLQELDDNGKTLWVVAADQFRFAVSTLAPLNFICYNDNVDGARIVSSNVQFGIRPMGSVVFSSNMPSQRSYMSVGVYYNNVALEAARLVFEEALNGMPYSLWGTVNDGTTAPDSKIIPDALVGLRSVSVMPQAMPPGPGMFPVSRFVPQPLPPRVITLWPELALKPAQPATHNPESESIISQTVMTAPVPEKRKAILDAVLAAGINVKTDGALPMMAAYAQAVFQSPPMLGSLGSIGYQATPPHAVTKTKRRISDAKKQTKTIPPVVTADPVIRFYTLQYPRPTLTTTVFMAASDKDVKKMIPVKGSLFRNGLLSGYTDRAFLRGVTRKSTATVKDIELLPGASATVDFEGQRTWKVTAAGRLPLYLLQFDENNQYLGGQMLGNGESIIQAAKTTQALYYGFDRDNVSLPYALGWHVTSQLIQVNPNALVGLGAVVMPQSPIRIREGRNNIGYGLIDGSVMMAQNRMAQGEGSIEASVITVLPAALQTLVVLYTNTDSVEVPDETHVTAAIAKETASGLVYENLHPVGFIPGALEYAVVYELPETIGSLYDVRTMAAEGWRQTGVLGLAEKPADVIAGWEQVVIKPAIADSLTNFMNVSVDVLIEEVVSQQKSKKGRKHEKQ